MHCRYSCWLPSRRAVRWLAAASPLLAVAQPPSGAAQDKAPVRVHAEVFAGSEIETYLRWMQTTGTSPLHPWSIRSFSRNEVDRLMPRDSVHPWSGQYHLAPDTADGPRFEWIRPRASAVYNSAFPHGDNDGAVWTGRGATVALEAGFSSRWGPVSLTIAPLFFAAQNAEFELVPNGLDDSLAYADWRYPTRIDFPQRFGDGSYVRLDPGQSTLRADLRGVAAGISTANQAWGPVTEYPILLGNNAPGFVHGFLGTSRPLNVGIGRVHGRMVWGRLEQSAYTNNTGTDEHRFMSGIVGGFTPRGIPGLELGLGRFFHSPWPEDGLSAEYFLKPVESLFKGRLRDGDKEDDPKSDADNQLASVFGRWVFPGSGFEVYGEYGREDHNWNLRDFILEPDHISAYALGFRKGWMSSGGRLLGLRGEVMNAQVSHLVQVRGQSPFYLHSDTRQGHTHRGQILGSPAVYGGAGGLLGLDYYHPGGRWSLEWSRTLRADTDVVHGLGAEAVVFRGGWELTGGLTGVYELDRYPGGDAFNLNASVQVRIGM
jgi:hypothetical protein